MTHLLVIFHFMYFWHSSFLKFYLFLFHLFRLKRKVHIAATYDNNGAFIVIPYSVKNCSKAFPDVAETFSKIHRNLVFAQDSGNTSLIFKTHFDKNKP